MGNATLLPPATFEVLLRPTAATFTDAGSGGTYGDDNADTIEVSFDGPIIAPGAAYAFWLDQSATVVGQGFGTGGALPATYSGNKVPFTITNAPSISGVDVPVASGVALWSMANLPANARHPDVDPAVRQPGN